MPSGLTRSPKLVKGALIELSDAFLVPVPNVIVFQYNPASFTRTITPWLAPAEGRGGARQEKESTGQPSDPEESFQLGLELDAADALEVPEKHPVAVVSGVADRIAALEMLLYPVGETLLGGQIEKLLGKKFARRGKVPVVLFEWGPGRIVPVRLTSFSVEEQAFSPTLYPIRATVTIGLSVLKPEVFKSGKSNGAQESVPLSWSEKIAITAYQFTRAQKELLALKNSANAVDAAIESIISEVV